MKESLNHDRQQQSQILELNTTIYMTLGIQMKALL
jgi:hypothetical protein